MQDPIVPISGLREAPKAGVVSAIERINAELAGEKRPRDDLQKALEMELKANTRIFHYVFANPYDVRWLSKKMKRKQMVGCIKTTESVKQGEPYIRSVEYDRRVDGFASMKRKLKNVWDEMCAENAVKPRGKYEIRLPDPHPRQRTIIYVPRRFKVMVCGRRFGKTTAALIAAVLRAVEQPKSIIYYIAPTYRQAKSIAWSMLSEMVGEAYKRKHEQELMYELPNGSKIFLKGADNPDSLRGTFVHFAILDEYAGIKPHVWDEIIRPMLLDTRGDAWFLGTPKGYDHFYQLWHDAFNGKLGNDWEAFRLSSWDNPFLDRGELSRMKEEMDSRSYSQEVLAEFVQFEGLVYQDFKRAEHVKAFDIEKVNGIDILGLDWGADHPTAAVFVRVGVKGDVYVYAEHYQMDKSVEEHVKAIKKIEQKYGKKVKGRYLDPSAKQVALDLRRGGLVTRKAVNDRTYGISELRRLLRDGKIHIHPSCVNLIYEFEHHRYKARKDGQSGDNKDVDKSVLKVDDDALDALRYAIASHFKGKAHKFEGQSYYLPEFEAKGLKRTFDKVNLRNNRKVVSKEGRVAPEFRL